MAVAAGNNRTFDSLVVPKLATHTFASDAADLTGKTSQAFCPNPLLFASFCGGAPPAQMDQTQDTLSNLTL